ncbi:MAG: TIGR04211 family SH3 domain-containing protein [Desulfobacterales bacterium]|nr:TIGR04211 family SH3 domain-containing protein [Desulfobacterales bacterium]MDD4391401.1 TIGR04211 family SH3 domain-containing protein [Desulfobacterales bacterium]
MKYFLLAMCFLTAFISHAHADTMYISDIREITMRTGRGLDHKIIALLKSGQQVDLIESGKDWSKVSLGTGNEGWVLSRYLSSEIPDSLTLKNLQEKHAGLQSRASVLASENTELKQANKTLIDDLSKIGKELDQTRTDYEALKKESAQFLELKSEHEQTTIQLSEQSQKVETYESELIKLKLSRNIKWFLTGAGVLLAGFIIGVSSKRRRSSSLL